MARGRCLHRKLKDSQRKSTPARPNISGRFPFTQPLWWGQLLDPAWLFPTKFGTWWPLSALIIVGARFESIVNQSRPSAQQPKASRPQGRPDEGGE
jgi:hypothetical protein